MKIFEQLKFIYNTQLRGPFPYEDARQVAIMAAIPLGDLIPEIDWFTSLIAGYSSSPERLIRLDYLSREAVRRQIDKDLYQKFPELRPMRPIIENSHSRLSALLTNSEEARRLLLAILDKSEMQ